MDHKSLYSRMIARRMATAGTCKIKGPEII
jgi:hypothetical protein